MESDNDFLDEQEEGKEQAQKNPPKQIASKKINFADKFTIDYIFSYETNKELNVLDRRLGYTYLIAFICIVCYCVLYVIVFEKLYLENEIVHRETNARVIGKAHSIIDNKIYVWDEAAIGTDHSEPNSIFIPTKIKITKGQNKSECASLSLPCFNDTDCKPDELPIYQEKNSCVNITPSVKGCVINQWCPIENEENNSTIVHSLIGASHRRVFIDASMSFHSLAPERNFTLMKKNKIIEYPTNGANVFLVSDLISLAAESYEDLKNLGCILQVNILWDCDLDNKEEECQPHLKVIRLDNVDSKGFNFRKGIYTNNENTRDLYSYTGIRIYFNNIGKGYKVSAFNIIIQIYTVIALVFGAKLITDCLMMNFYREKKHYTMMKQIETKDMND